MKSRSLEKHGARLILGLVMALVIMLAMPAMGASDATVTVNITPAFISITNSPNNWTINGDYGGSGTAATDTTYYANPWGDEQAPNSTVADGDCRFEITNTSTVATDISVNFGNFTRGDAMTNSNTRSNAASSYAPHRCASGSAYA